MEWKKPVEQEGRRRQIDQVQSVDPVWSQTVTKISYWDNKMQMLTRILMLFRDFGHFQGWWCDGVFQRLSYISEITSDIFTGELVRVWDLLQGPWAGGEASRGRQRWNKTGYQMQGLMLGKRASGLLTLFSLPLQNFITVHFKKVKNRPGWCGSVDWALACEPKGRWFDSQSGHMPGLQVRFPGVGRGRGNHTLMFLSLSFSLPSPLSKIK